LRTQLSTLAICLGLLATTSCSEKLAAPEPIIQDVGTSILSGTGDPSPSIGKDGDFYINLSTQTLYGPKLETNWGAGIVLSGSAGADGTNGSNEQDGKNGNTLVGEHPLASSLPQQIMEYAC